MMEDLKENKSVVTSYRLGQDTKDKLQQQLKDLGVTQEQYFNKVVSLMELENVKENGFLSKDTTIIQSNLDAILNAFINIAEGSNNLISNKEVELESLKSKYKDMLSNKEDLITTQKQQLQDVYDNLNVLQTEKEKTEKGLIDDYMTVKKQNTQLEASLQDKNLIVEEYREKNDMLLGDLSEYKQFKIEVDQYKKLLSDSQSKVIEKDNVIKDINYNINNLNKELQAKDSEINNLKLNNEQYIKDLKNDNIKELESLKKESSLNMKLSVADVKETLNNKLIEEHNKHNADLEAYQTKRNAEIEQYQSKYKTLLEELEKVRAIQNS